MRLAHGRACRTGDTRPWRAARFPGPRWPHYPLSRENMRRRPPLPGDRRRVYGYLLRKDATVGGPLLVAVDGVVGETENALGVQRRPRSVGRVAALPVGHTVRGGEVRVRTVDQGLRVRGQCTAVAIGDPE